jgi:hypothetical protein
MLVEKPGDLLERLLGLGRADVTVVVGVRLPFIDLQGGLDPGLTQLAMPYCSAGDRVCRW